MTREEEIKQAAQAYYPSGSLHEYRTVPAFVRGAKWADENQIGMTKMRKDYEFLFMLKKQELIKKACEWLDINCPNIDNVGSWYKDSFIKQFKKAMEE